LAARAGVGAGAADDRFAGDRAGVEAGAVGGLDQDLPVWQAERERALRACVRQLGADTLEAADRFSVREQVPGFVADVAGGLSGRLGVEGDVEGGDGAGEVEGLAAARGRACDGDGGGDEGEADEGEQKTLHRSVLSGGGHVWLRKGLPVWGALGGDGPSDPAE